MKSINVVLGSAILFLAATSASASVAFPDDPFDPGCLYSAVVPDPLATTPSKSVTLGALGSTTGRLWAEPCARQVTPGQSVDNQVELLAVFEKTFAAPTSFYSYQISYQVYVSGSLVASGSSSASKTVVPAESNIAIPVRLGRVPKGAQVRVVIGGTEMVNGIAPSGGASTYEFRHSGFNHYFITSAPAESAAILAGKVGQEWMDTGASWRAFDQALPGTSPVCRFFSATFAPKSSHFYTPYPSECASLKTGDVWGYEEIAFHAVLPNAAGTCSSDTRPMYRVYNNGLSGAPNHRYMIDRGIREQMVAAGGVAEGAGTDSVFACVPK